MNNYDVIIIGGGVLAKEGKTVLLIEQHYIPGGCAATFKRGTIETIQIDTSAYKH
jgi:phytoene dehydrogenase-like protein